MEHSRAFVFKEIITIEQTLYLWFKLDEDERITPDVVLTADEHWALVNAD